MLDGQFSTMKNMKARGKNSEKRTTEGHTDPTRGVVLGPKINIEQFQEQYRPDSKHRNIDPTYECSAFDAVSGQNTAHGENKLDSTGGITAVCRHDFILLVC